MSFFMIYANRPIKKLPTEWRARVNKWQRGEKQAGDEVWHLKINRLGRIVLVLLMTFGLIASWLLLIIVLPFIWFNFAEQTSDFVLLAVAGIAVLLFAIGFIYNTLDIWRLVRLPQSAFLALAKEAIVFVPHGRRAYIVPYQEVKKMEISYWQQGYFGGTPYSYSKDKIILPGAKIAWDKLSPINNYLGVYFSLTGNYFSLEIHSPWSDSWTPELKVNEAARKVWERRRGGE